MSIDWRSPPRAHDASLRLHHHGRLQPMHVERPAGPRPRTLGALAFAILVAAALLRAL